MIVAPVVVVYLKDHGFGEVAQEDAGIIRDAADAVAEPGEGIRYILFLLLPYTNGENLFSY
jgi:hypothetical protein